jgi:PKD repeat protein
MKMMKRMILVIGVCALMMLVVLFSGCTTEKEDEENKPPSANAGSDLYVTVGEQFSFNGSGSDVDGQIVLYEWDVDGDDIYDKSCQMCGKDSHIYEKIGKYNAKLRVTDDDGATSTDICVITVSQ